MSEQYPLVGCICLDPGGRPDFIDRAKRCYEVQTYPCRVPIFRSTSEPKATVGKWRNYAISGAISVFPRLDVIAHWDWDDWSAPDRLSLQLAHIQKTGKFVTGFYSMPLYDTQNDKVWIYEHEDHRYALGTSLFYKRKAWERVKFPDKTPEDPEWLRDIGFDNRESRSVFREDGTPIMIQTIHGANASARIIRSSPRYREATDEQAARVREILKSA